MRPLVLSSALLLILHATGKAAEDPWFQRGPTAEGRYDQCVTQAVSVGGLYGDEKGIRERCGDDPRAREIDDYFRCHGFDENGIYTGKPAPKDCS